MLDFVAANPSDCLHVCVCVCVCAGQASAAVVQPRQKPKLVYFDGRGRADPVRFVLEVCSNGVDCFHSAGLATKPRATPLAHGRVPRPHHCAWPSMSTIRWQASGLEYDEVYLKSREQFLALQQAKGELDFGQVVGIASRSVACSSPLCPAS